MKEETMVVLGLLLCFLLFTCTVYQADRPSLGKEKADVKQKVDSAVQPASKEAGRLQAPGSPQGLNPESYAYRLFKNMTVIPPGSYDEQIQQLEDALQTLSSSWDVSDAVCSDTSCMGEFSKTNGDTATATLTYYPSPSDAQSAYNSAKNAHGDYRVVEIAVGDGGYAWQYRSQSEAGFIEGQTVGIVDYYVVSGDADITGAVKLAGMIAKDL